MSHFAADSDDTPSTASAPNTSSAHEPKPSGPQHVVASAFAKFTPSRPTVTYHHPRPTLWFVIRRTWARSIAMQVWDVEATLTFYMHFAVLPALSALTSMVSLVDFTEEDVWTIGGLVDDLIPASAAAWVLA